MNQVFEKKQDDQSYELLSELVSLRRTAKVVRGGRIFRFSATVVVGDGNGQIGIGIAHGMEVSIAFQKAQKQAKQDLTEVKLTENKTVQHTMTTKFGATKVHMRPAPKGTGIIAGGAMRQVFKVAGVENVLGKILGSSTAQNVARATIKSLREMRNPEQIASKRDINVRKIQETTEG
jgi:small subunit ribosomal protein S5